MFYLCFNYVILFIHNKLPIDNHCAGRTFKLKYLLFAKLILPAPIDASFWYCFFRFLVSTIPHFAQFRTT